MRHRKPSAGRTRHRARLTHRREQLEARLPLTADLSFAGVLADQAINEGGSLDLSFDFTDTVATAPAGVGIDPTDPAFTSLGDFTATSDLFINTSNEDITFTRDDTGATLNPLTVTIPALSLWAGDESGGSIVAEGTVFDKDGPSGPAVETYVFVFDSFTLGAGFELRGVGERPIAILTTGDLTIDGTVDVGAQRTGLSGLVPTGGVNNEDFYIPGAGGGAGGVGRDTGNVPISVLQGQPALGAPAESAGVFRGGTPTFSAGFTGSGAGFGGVGGDSNSDNFGNFSPGGVSYGDLATTGIQGGSGGGAGQQGRGRLNQGGDGGGGIELGALGDVFINGTVKADAGPDVWFGAGRRGGGGAGGGILVHGDNVSLGTTSLLTASGRIDTPESGRFSGGPVTGEGAGGRILVAHSGALSNAGVDNLLANPTPVLDVAPEADGVVETLQVTPQSSQDNYAFTVDLLDSVGAVIETLVASTPVTDIVLSTAGDSLTGSVALTGLTSTQFGDDADLQVRVTVSDDQATPNVIQDTFLLAVNNVAPAVVAASGPVAGQEGDTLTASGSFSDVAADPLTFTASIGTVTPDGLGGWNWSLDAQDDFAGVVTITADDGDGGLTDTTFDLTVNNVAPVLANLTTDSSVIFEGALEGEAVNLSATFTDAGVLDTHTAVIDWGDGTVTPGVVDQVTGTVSGSNVYADAGFYEVTVTLTDDDTGATTEVTQVVVSGVALQDGTLVGIGTNENDFIKVFRFYGQYKVLSRIGAGPVTWETFGGPVNGIDLQLGGGNDLGFVSRWVHVDAAIDGGDGNDTVVGGAGNDLLLGGAGNDWLYGRGGRDLIVAGAGSDYLFGDGGQDILVSGTTAFDTDRAALDLILAEWTSNRSFSERVDNLQGSGLGLNEDNFLIASGPDQTVFDDGVFDFLYGGGGSDLHFAGSDDLSLAGFFDQLEVIESEGAA